MKEELKPCPFCGFKPDRGDADFVYPVTRDKSLYEAVCYESGGGCSSHVIGWSAEEAIRKWNRRTALSEQAAAPVAENIAPIEHLFIVRCGKELYAGWPHKTQAEVYASGFSKECSIEMMLLTPPAQPTESAETNAARQPHDGDGEGKATDPLPSNSAVGAAPHVSVPREPTEEIIIAGCNAGPALFSPMWFRQVWAAALAAAETK